MVNKIIIWSLVILLIASVAFNFGITGSAISLPWVKPTQTITTTPDKGVDIVDTIGVGINTIKLTELCEIVCPPTTPWAISTKCIDSDGVNVLVSGTCKDSAGAHKDNCVGNTLEEWACNIVTNKCVSIKVDCIGITVGGVTIRCNVDKCGFKI